VPDPFAAVFQPANEYPARVNVFAVRFDATFASWALIVPDPPLLANVTA
jgi:hypothetical protein